jgi:hypothetical protein
MLEAQGCLGLVTKARERCHMGQHSCRNNRCGPDPNLASTEMYKKIFPGYQPCKMVKRRRNQRFKEHLYPYLQGTDQYRDGPWNIVFSPLNHLTRLVTREYFIIHCRRESYKSYIEMYSWQISRYNVKHSGSQLKLPVFMRRHIFHRLLTTAWPFDINFTCLSSVTDKLLHLPICYLPWSI